jgi:putative ATP-binding cassette transporter
MVSLRRIRVLFDSLSEEALTREVTKVANWTALHFVGVSYEHRESDGASFRVGPIDLQITRGQITFIVGGNGSGKSTLSKLITLHYLPESGAIRFGDTLVNEITRESCRQQISAVYSDYYLFDRLHGIVGDDIQARAGAYLRLLRLDHKVSIRAGCFSTLDLSTGQRKRLALLVAFLEDKELYLFDEWAADQDPEFKAVFYNQILPDLKARNKAVVVISHDDKYFHIADQILTMTEGRCMTHRDQHAGTVPANGKEPPAMKLGEHV